MNFDKTKNFNKPAKSSIFDTPVILRRELGEVLRDERDRQGRTLREVSTAARVSLGYLSEVERGLKEASSELLGSICAALEVPMSFVLRATAERIAIAEGVLGAGAIAPDYVPDGLADGLLASSPTLRDAAWRDIEKNFANQNAGVAKTCDCATACRCDELALV
jgi:transcriptional regulator with XRE-family HTH domain